MKNCGSSIHGLQLCRISRAILWLWAGLTASGWARELTVRTEANVAVELTFHARGAYADPFNEVALDATFIDPKGRELRVPGFWAGGEVWKVRYASPLTGRHKFRVEWSQLQSAGAISHATRSDFGAHGHQNAEPPLSGTVEIRPYTGANPLFLHGPVQVSANRRYLEHADHTPFFWLGDTWWMGLCHRLHWPDEFQQLAADRKEKGFNVIQIVAGLYPDMFPFDPRGANEAGFPWETNYTRMRPEYFDAADKRLGYLVEQGFTPCIVGAWGYFMPWMGVEKMKAHWRYLIARYGAWPVVWCAAGEGNLPWYLAKGFPYDDRKQVGDWTEVMRYMRETDPFHRPLTIHPTGIGPLTARHSTDDPGLLDFDMLQTPHGQREAVPITVQTVRASYAAEARMPVIDGEASYERLNDSLPTEWTRRMFWLCLMNGAAGHTYGANGIWQCNRPEQPHGKSPHGGSYGKIPWNEAMRLPGSEEVGFGKKLFEQFAWQQFRPHPEWASFAGAAPLSFEGCHWIWFPEGNPARDAPVAKRFCRRTFVVAADAKIKDARLRISVDDWFSAKLNGQSVGTGENWSLGRQFNDLARFLRPGTNVLAIVAENKAAAVKENPAGLIACLEIEVQSRKSKVQSLKSEVHSPQSTVHGSQSTDQSPTSNVQRSTFNVQTAETAGGAATGLAERSVMLIVSDEEWRWSKNDGAGWELPGFDDESWASGMVIGNYGMGPWGRIGGETRGDFNGPQAAGIPGVVRMIYVPENESVRARLLEPGGKYEAWYFDPVSGATNRIGKIEATSHGMWACPAPVGNDHDWVVVLESPKSEIRNPKSELESPKSKVESPKSEVRSPKSGVESPQSTVHRPQSTEEAPKGTDHGVVLSNGCAAWHLDWSEGRLRTTWFENYLSGRRFAVSEDQEVALSFSAAADRVAQPVQRVEDFEVLEARSVVGPAEAATNAKAGDKAVPAPGEVVFELQSRSLAVEVRLHFQLDGPTRRKWVEVTNRAGKDLLLLDVDLDDLTTDGTVSGGGQGQPVFLEDEVFVAIEHPAGFDEANQNHIHLAHYPGKRLAPGETFVSHAALVSVAKRGGALEHFVSYIQAKSRRATRGQAVRAPALSVYTPFGINNQWGACPTLDDEETLNVLDLLGKWEKRGVHFDYFTLDTGWVDPNSDLTRFRPTCFPNGPGEIVRRVDALGMKFGLWFATGWAAESCWDYPAGLSGQSGISMPYRLGYPDKAHEGHMFCFGSEAYFKTLKNAVLYHVRENKVRLLKFDGGNYYCDSAEHGHLPGKYSVEPMFDKLLDIAQSARAVAPDVFIMWYWGLRSPFWAIYGDLIFESGLQMEGSGTSTFPALYYRDSVTLAQDQNAQFAKTIPPAVKDSLGVWLADNRWGNFMGKERWREALVMDFGRGNLVVPNIWGNLHHLSDEDVDFLGRMMAIAKQNEALFQHRRSVVGDPARNEVYGYANCDGGRGFLFLNNAYFTARKAEVTLDGSIGLDAKQGSSLRVASFFPEAAQVRRPDGERYRAGDTLSLWLRPFEVLMIGVGESGARTCLSRATRNAAHAKGTSPTVEISDVAADRNVRAPWRSVSREQVADLGCALALKPATLDSKLDMRFADAATFASQNLKKKVYAFETRLPSLAGPQPILAVAIRLRKGDSEWKHAPTVVQIVQALARIGDQNAQMAPVPDGRQFGNTQSAGCSWVLYKVRLNREWAGEPIKLAVHAWLPEDVDAKIEGWIVKQWWKEDARPGGDGYYNDAPS
ncbi:MAG: hypothetical protein C5B50_07940 [Verrucomicrobia bacterium]|nr:MAG: hypothetical protein C5B50_07940 [Verrucomicrobiota bacterium]